MKKRIVIMSIALIMIVTLFSACKKDQAEPAPYEETLDQAETPYAFEEEDITNIQTGEFDHVIKVKDVEIGLKDVPGYKPYVLCFQQVPEGSYCNGDAFFIIDDTITDLDKAKWDGVISEYHILNDECMLVIYVAENSKDMSMMPLPDGYEQDYDVDMHYVFWNDAAMKKIGAGNSYNLIDIYPAKDFINNELACVKLVRYENFENGCYPSWSDGVKIIKPFLFVDSVSDWTYELVK